MDGPFYLDTREPFIASDLAVVTLTSSYKALYTASNFPVLGGQYFARLGKKLHIRAFGRITTGATPGNLTIGVIYGNGADSNGVILQQTNAIAITALQTNMSWWLDVYVHCRSTGSTGTLFADGKFQANVAVLPSTSQPMMIPASSAAVSGAVDLTAALIISIQAQRSGVTVETMQIHDLEVVPMN